MKELKELLKRSFELWVKMRWLKTIDKEVKKRRKYFFKYKRQEYINEQIVRIAKEIMEGDNEASK